METYCPQSSCTLLKKSYLRSLPFYYAIKLNCFLHLYIRAISQQDRITQRPKHLIPLKLQWTKGENNKIKISFPVTFRIWKLKPPPILCNCLMAHYRELTIFIDLPQGLGQRFSNWGVTTLQPESLCPFTSKGQEQGKGSNSIPRIKAL